MFYYQRLIGTCPLCWKPMNTWYNKKKISIKFCTQSEGRFLFNDFVVAVAFMLCNEHRDFFLLCQPNFIQLGYLYFTSCKQCNELNPNQPGGWNFKNVAVQLLLVSIATNGFFLEKKTFFLFEFLLNNQFSYFVNSSAFYLCVTAKLLSMGHIIKRSTSNFVFYFMLLITY